MTKCCRQTHGCFSVRNWSILCLLLGIMLITIAIVLPPVINKMVETKVCDKVCIPLPTDDAVTQDYWLRNTNRERNPEEIYKFWVYNLTNHQDMMMGAHPKLTMHGPYVYQLYREKYNVTYNDDQSEVAYESREMYTFLPEQSGNLSESDLFISVNIPTVASWYLIMTSELPSDVRELSLRVINQQCLSFPSGDKSSCLFATRTAHDVIFKQDSALIDVANTFFFTNSQDVKITQLHPILNGSSNEDWSAQQRLGHNFGFGGIYKPRVIHFSNQAAIVLKTVGAAPGYTGDLRTRQMTGHGSLADLSQTNAYIGNTTLGMWNNKTVPVQGRDSYQVQPFLNDDDVVSIFDPQIMRSINLEFQRKVTLLDIEMNRYYPNNLFDGYDQTYYGPGISGLFNATQIATIRYGVPTPIYVSRPYLAKVNSTWNQHIECTNCPNVNQMTPDDLETIVDIEPNIGKVLRGKKRAQTNVLLGDPAIFSNATDDPTGLFQWKNITKTLVPVVWFEYGAEMTPHQADQVRDGVDQIHLAHTVRVASLYGGSVSGGLLIVFAIVLFFHYRRLQKAEQLQLMNEREAMMNVAGQGDGVYGSRQHYQQFTQ